MFSLTVMRAFAIFAISNSHLRELHRYSFLATGGMLGNTVFFFISGFGVTLALLAKPEPLNSWYQRRLFRIYEPLVILTSLFLLIGYRTVSGGFDIVRLYVFPYEYWFIPAIAVLYIPSYLFARFGSKFDFIVAFIVLTVAYLVFYLTIVDLERWNVEDHLPVKSIYYFSTMLCGIYIAKFHPSFVPANKGFLVFAVCTVSFFGFLFAMQKWKLYQIQATAELFAFLWTLSFYWMLRNNGNISWIKSKAGLTNGINFVSAITLQMYLLGEFIFSQKALKLVPYPLNILVFFVALIASAWALSKVSSLAFLGRARLQSQRGTR